jgi:DNA-binding MarR family transcriptional regulator
MADADEVNGALEPGRLADLLGFHLRLASAAMARDFMDAVAETGLTQKQAAILELVSANPGVSQVDLARTLGTDRATMMALVDRLTHRRLLSRRRSEADRRRQELVLTPAGEALLATSRRLIAAHERRFLKRFTAPERDRLVEMLKRIYGR